MEVMPLQKQIGECKWEYGLYMAIRYADKVNGFRFLVSVDDNWLHALEYIGVWRRITEYHNQGIDQIKEYYKETYNQSYNPIFRDDF